MKLHALPRGAALIIVLAFVLLLSGLITAYFARAISARKLSDSSFNQLKADQLAESATDIVVSDLKKEIADGSNKSTNGIYYPITNQDMLPRRSPAIAAGTPDPILNLVRRSVQSDTIAAPGVSSRASAVSSNATAINGRSISDARWNSHYLAPRQNTGITIDSTPLSGFKAPDWVFVTEKGPEVLTTPKSASSPVIGRYAFAIYDEGGLLDVNVAGYPYGTTAAQIGDKAALAFADLTVLGIPNAAADDPRQVDRIVGWRNYASAQALADSSTFPKFTFDAAAVNRYYDSVLNNQSGFRTVANAQWNGQTDQAFLTRQQLLAFRRATGFTQNALQYLTTFTRDIEEPSYRPDPARLKIVGSEDNGGNDAHNFDDEINPAFLDVLADGKPVAKQRFPLSRLALITSTATAGTGDPIYKYFGLSRSDSSKPWKYDHGKSSGGIMRLSEVAAVTPAREPDMAELLKAAINVGSVGKTAKQSSWNGGDVADPAKLQNERDGSVDFQIIQILANIIDQYDADGYPTEIDLSQGASASAKFFGVEDLPYFAGIIPMAVKTGGNDGRMLLQPMIWNPHQSGSPGTPRPASFQVTADSGSDPFFIKGNATTTAAPWDENADNISFLDSPTIAREPTLLRDSAGGIFTATAGATQAAVATVSFSGKDLQYTTGSGTYFGFKSGEFTGKWSSVFSGAGGRIYGAGGGTPGGLSFKLWYVPAGGGARRLYQEVRVPSNSSIMVMGKSTNGGQSPGFKGFTSYDPRTSRFGWVTFGEPGQTMYNGTDDYARYDTPVSLSAVNSTYKPIAYFSRVASGSSYSAGIMALRGDPKDSGWTVPSPIRPAFLAENKATSEMRYQDPDGVLRRAGGAYASDLGATSTVGLPLATDSPMADRRPFMLNRPFRSVAEIGVAFRGTPWKNIDFFTPESGDSALLDVFCLRENASPDAVVAGKLSLNSRQPKVLEAILMGAFKNSLSPTSQLTSAEAANLAAKLVARTRGTNAAVGEGPLENVGDLVGRWEPTASQYHGFSEDLTSPPYANSDDSRIKRIRETGIRALAGVGSTRVWNLMIDVIAQAGRHPPAASALVASGTDQFIVEGEQRLWVHIAIDRLTGATIDQSVEVVRE